jgi:hypothetical protein
VTLSRPVLAVGGVVLLVIAAVVLWPKQRLTPSEEVRRQVIQATRAAEEKDLSSIMDQVSERFRMDNGADRMDLKRLLAGRLLLEKWIRVFLVDLSVTEANGGVDVEAKLIFGNSRATTLQELAATSALQGYAIDAHYTKEADGHWRAVSARGKPLSAQDLVSLTP